MSPAPLHRRLSTWIACLPLCACGALDPRPDPSRFFVITPTEAVRGRQELALPGSLTVGLGPVELARYLARPEMIVRRSPTEVSRAQIDRWAEALDTMLPRVLGEDLALQLGPQRFVPFPWYPDQAPTLQVRIRFSRFEREGDQALLSAFWRVIVPATNATLLEHQSHLTQPVLGDDPSVLAQALSDLLAELSLEIADGLMGCSSSIALPGDSD